MTSQALTNARQNNVAGVAEEVLIGGDLEKLSPAERVNYYRAVCRSLGLNELTKPFEYIRLNNKLTLYARKDATDQLRALRGVSIEITQREKFDDVYVVTAVARTKDGRTDSATGAVAIAGLKGEAMANAFMKAECVPLDSEILTRRGFRRYDEVAIGEDVLAYDVRSDTCTWTPLRNVTVHDSLPIAHLHTPSRWSVFCTPDHSWAVQRGQPYKPDKRGTGERGARGPYASRGPARGLVKASEINTTQRIILAAPTPGGIHPLTPREAAILGWVMTDGTIRRRGPHVDRIGISQSKPETVAVVRELIGASATESVTPARTQTFPSGKAYEVLPQHWFYLNAVDSRALLDKAGIASAADLPKLAPQLSTEAREAMLVAMMMADGDQRGVFGKKRKPGVMEAFQILATLQGIALGTLGHSSVGDVPVQRMRKTRTIAGSNLSLEVVGEQPAWCPTTDYGTWVMRQNGRVMITGNTKAKRRVTLSLVGLGWLDEAEVESIDATAVDVDQETGEIREPSTAESQPGRPQRPQGDDVAQRRFWATAAELIDQKSPVLEDLVRKALGVASIREGWIGKGRTWDEALEKVRAAYPGAPTEPATDAEQAALIQ